MQKRLPIVVLGLGLAAALAIAVVLLLQDHEPSRDGDPPRISTDAADRGDAAPDEGPQRGAASPDRAKATRFAPGDDDPSTAKAPGGQLLEIEIVRAGTNEPVPEAKVSWWPRSDDSSGAESFETWLRDSAVEEHARSAVQLQSDPRGRVRVPDLDAGFVVEAESGDLWGYKSFGAVREKTARVVIAPETDIRVRVVDEAGAPVIGAPVALRSQLGAPSQIDRLTARTQKPDGIAVLRHANRVLRSASESKPTFVVALQGLLDPPVQREIDRDRASTELLTLVVPRTGSCEVVVVDARNEAVLVPIEARLRFADQRPRPGPDTKGSGEAIVRRALGRIVFEHVAVGRELVVAVQREGAETPEEVRGPGPERPGDRVQLRVRLGDDVAVLRGRIVDKSGATGLRARARLEAGDPEVQFEDGGWVVRAAADGRFSLITKPSTEAIEGLTLAIYRLSERDVDVAVARRPISGGLSAGVHDLGDFVFADVPMVAEGEVIDPEGRPVESAWVVPSVPTGPNPTDPGASPPHKLRSGFTDARGRFEIRGEFGHPQVALVAQKTDVVAEPIVVRSGERGVRLVLGAAGTVDGSVLLDPSLAAAMIRVEAVRDGTPGQAPGPADRNCMLDREGRFALRGLRTGAYSVRVVDATSEKEIGAVSGVVVQAGKCTRDPRLDPLDLRDAFRAIALETVDERGDPVRDAAAFARPSGDADAKWAPAQAAGDRLIVMSPGGRAVDVVVSAAGFVRTELERVNASQRVTLRRAAQIRLRLASGLRPPALPFSLAVELTPVQRGRSAPFEQPGAVNLDDRGELTCQTPFVGDLQVAFVLSHSDLASPVRVQQEAPSIISVTTGGGEQVFEIRFDQAKLEEAQRALVGGK